jgi:hypothetical protein
MQAEGLPDPFIRLAKPAVMIAPGKFDTLSGDKPPIIYGDLLTLKDWDFPTNAAPGETITVKLGWKTTSRPIKDSYSIGIYLFDSAGKFIQGFDSPPLNGKLLTYSLPTDYLFEESRQVTLPTIPDKYTAYIGIYNTATMERLPVPGSQDNIVNIGVIDVKQS